MLSRLVPLGVIAATTRNSPLFLRTTSLIWICAAFFAPAQPPLPPAAELPAGRFAHQRHSRSVWHQPAAMRAHQHAARSGQLNRTTAGIIVIGDEILSGSTRDTNSHFLTVRLHKRGVLVKKISVIGDQVDEIAEEIRRFSTQFDVVFTSGGIGPTHDDRTFEGLGRAFDEELHLNEELRQVVEIFLKKTKLKDVDTAVEKFCQIPKSAKLLWGKTDAPTLPSEMNRFPSVQMRNVICFPGVPKFCELAYEQIEDTVFPVQAPIFSRLLYLKRNEVYLQEQLTELAERFQSDHLTIGSYPVMENSYYKTKIVVESVDSIAGQRAFDEIARVFAEFVVNYDEEPWIETVPKMEVFRNTTLRGDEFAQRFDRSIQVIDEALEQYSLVEIAIAFNGGKDCTALLHLLRSRIDKKYGPETRIQAFHILCGEEFAEMADFIRDAARVYRLDINELNGPMREGLSQLRQRRPHIRAVFMGSRQSDPNGRHMKSEGEWTDKDWPQFFRVCPILRWHYADVWRLLRSLCIPYCPLYDRGYTSLGDRTKTVPNEVLKQTDGRYLPAYRLTEDALERHGRLEAAPKL
ncbi:MoCF-biosynth domain-containing protein [Aphelenchoides fujianensis]|nr:MoCF-biosynth domain-containing protein [Aphelenchoides fujianensis]